MKSLKRVFELDEGDTLRAIPRRNRTQDNQTFYKVDELALASDPNESGITQHQALGSANRPPWHSATGLRVQSLRRRLQPGL